MNWINRLQIYRENRSISKAGCCTVDGQTVRLPKTGSALAADTVCFAPDAVIPQPVSRNTVFSLSESTVQSDTVSTVLSLREEGLNEEIIALNFANAMAAGGGYRLGGDAQEESLCRCSLLYDAIKGNKQFYRPHRLRPTPFYSDRILVSPSVPIIRRTDGSLLAVPAECTFLTCAAVNRNFAKLLLRSDKKIEAAMQQRIEKIITVIAERRPCAAVLGAFGCGMFGNKRQVILPMFEDAVNRLMPDTVRVVFADPRNG